MQTGCRLATLIVALTVSGAAGAADTDLHSLIFFEGRYAGIVDVRPPNALLWPPPGARRDAALLSVERRGRGLTLAWEIGGEGRSAAVVGDFGPSSYAPPDRWHEVDLECRPGSLPPFRVDRRAVAVHLVCFPAGNVRAEAVLRIVLAILLDPSTQRITERLSVRFGERDVESGGRRQRDIRGLLVRRVE